MCSMSVKCPKHGCNTDFSYKDEIVKQVIIHGRILQQMKQINPIYWLPRRNEERQPNLSCTEFVVHGILYRDSFSVLSGHGYISSSIEVSEEYISEQVIASENIMCITYFG